MYQKIKKTVHKQMLNPNNKTAFVSVIMLGLAAHMYIFTNKIPNHDDVHQLVYDMDVSQSGRWFLKFAAKLSSDFSLPWLNGILILLYIFLCVLILINIFKIKSKIITFFVSGLMVTAPYLTALMPYTNSVDAYTFGCLLAFVGLWISTKWRFGFLFSWIFFVLSLAIYQIYLGLVAAIFIIYIILKSLQNCDMKEIVFKIIKFGISIFVGVLIYLITIKIASTTELTSYGNFNTMGELPIAKLPNIIIVAYKEFIKFFILRSFNYQFSIMKLMYILSFLSIIILIVFIVRKEKTRLPNLMISIALFSILPLASNLIYILAWNTEVGLRMLSGYVAIYLLPLLLIDHFFVNPVNTYEKDLIVDLQTTKTKDFISLNKGKSYLLIAMCILFFATSISIYNNIYQSNRAYFKLDLVNKNINAYSNRIAMRIESVSGYERDFPVIFYGDSTYTTNFTNEISPPDLVPFGIVTRRSKSWSYKFYFERFLALPNPISRRSTSWGNSFSEDEKTTIEGIVEKMPIYPDEGSIKIIDDVIYIKFEEFVNEK